MDHARAEYWASAYQTGTNVEQHEYEQWSQERLRAAEAQYFRCLVDYAMSGLEELTAAMTRYRDAATRTNNTVKWATVVIVIATVVYAVAAVWQTTLLRDQLLRPPVPVVVQIK